MAVVVTIWPKSGGWSVFLITGHRRVEHAFAGNGGIGAERAAAKTEPSSNASTGFVRVD
jgi:hypothetical protein